MMSEVTGNQWEGTTAFESVPPAVWQAVLDGTPAAIFICGIDGSVTGFNGSARAFWGNKLSIGADGQRFFAPYLRSSPLGISEDSPLTIAIRSRAPIHEHGWMVEKVNGKLFHAQLSCLPLKNTDGEITAVLNCFVMTNPAENAVSKASQEDLLDMIGARERLFHQALNALPAAIYTTDPKGQITFYNEAAVSFAGRRPKIGQNWGAIWKISYPDGTPMPPDQYPMALALKTGCEIRGAESLAERPDGLRIAFLSYPTPLFEEDGALVGAVNMLVDITERKKYESQLRQLNEALEHRVVERTAQAEKAFTELHASERNFALMIESVIDYAIYTLDPAGHVSSWNAGAERIKGYTSNEILGKNFSCFYTQEDLESGLPAEILSIARREGRYETEGWRIRKNGSQFWASVIIDAIYNQGNLIGFTKVTRDVSERKAAERALIESESRARGVIDTSLDGFAQLDSIGLIVEWNPRAESMFGWAREEALGQKLGALITASGADAGHASENMSFDMQDTSFNEGHRQIDAVRRDGTTLRVELSVSILHLSSGELFNIFIRDLSEKIHIEAQLRQAQKMEAVGQITGGIAHDFNNLLQGIIGSLELAQLRIDEGKVDDLNRFIDGASSSAKRAATLTHRLLAFSRRQPLDPRPFRANQSIVSMEDLLKRTMGERIDIEFQLAANLWTTLCDPNQLESALLNLAINARDAMPEGGKLLIRSRNAHITDAQTSRRYGGMALGEYVCVEVLDTGLGMSEDVTRRAFDPFFTTKPAGQGTGLGLSMVFGFAQQSNGHCVIESQLGIGTKITLYLPRLIGNLAKDEEMTKKVTVRTLGHGEVVLVVEDEPVVRKLVVEVLDRLGYLTLEAADGHAGLLLLESSAHIDLLISDIGLPGLDGRKMTDAALAVRPDLKVILMTAYASGAAVPEGFLSQGMRLIAKPFTMQALEEQVQNILRRT